MNILKLISQTLVQMAKAFWALPKTVSNALKQRQQRAVMEELNAERLDRIRNPSKYRGK